jgi:hypothetical protein
MTAQTHRSTGVTAFLFGVIAALLAITGWTVWAGLSLHPPAEGVAGIEMPRPNLPDTLPAPPPSEPLPHA